MANPSVVGPGTLVSAAVICFCAGGLYGWSALIPVIETKFEGSTEQSGLVFSIAIVAFSLAVIILPRFPPRFHGLQGCVVFGLCGAMCLVVAMMASTYLLFLLAFGLGFGVCSGAIYINALTTAAHTARPAVITPLLVASFGMGGAVFGLVWRVLVLQGWGALALLSLVISLVGACLAGYIVNRRSAPIVKVAKESLSVPLTVVQPTVFILLWFSFSLGSVGGLMVLGLAGKIIDSIGATAAITSTAIVGAAIGNTVGRLSVSGFNFVIQPVNTALLAAGVAAIGLIIMGTSASPWLVVIGLIIVATGYGAVASTIPALVSSIYGKENFARVFSFVFTAWGLAGLIAPWLAGVIHDQTGDFQMAILFALLASVGALLTLLSLKMIAIR